MLDNPKDCSERIFVFTFITFITSIYLFAGLVGWVMTEHNIAYYIASGMLSIIIIIANVYFTADLKGYVIRGTSMGVVYGSMLKILYDERNIAYATMALMFLLMIILFIQACAYKKRNASVVIPV